MGVFYFRVFWACQQDWKTVSLCREILRLSGRSRRKLAFTDSHRFPGDHLYQEKHQNGHESPLKIFDIKFWVLSNRDHANLNYFVKNIHHFLSKKQSFWCSKLSDFRYFNKTRFPVTELSFKLVIAKSTSKWITKLSDRHLLYLHSNTAPEYLATLSGFGLQFYK